MSAKKTIASINKKLDECKTLVWNGPLGVFELKPFDNATNKVAQHAATLTQEGRLMTVAGGGDTVSALDNAGVADKFSYISTAGGAFLEWMEGKRTPRCCCPEEIIRQSNKNPAFQRGFFFSVMFGFFFIIVMFGLFLLQLPSDLAWRAAPVKL